MPTVLIQDLNSESSFEISENDTLYNEILALGVDLPHGCLSGSCGACRVQVIEGSENLGPISLIEQNTIDSLKEEFALKKETQDLATKNIRLACRAKVLGSIKISKIG